MNTEDKVLPPGTVFLTTITNLQKGPIISPSTQTTVTPLPPNNVSAVESGTAITITATVYIDAADDINSLDVYIAQPLTGDTQDVYFVYDYEEEIPNALYPYTFSFEIEDPNKSIKNIESYLWDEDPVTSRGTVTPVEGHGN
ncbi:hypothetical protein ACFSKN_14190 [Mariniflexile gromovii]|uniref:Uncharacterized protein n=1 Tax=Mariniflexile gromovii TaxID=362523 RepID=A0ABS4BRD0_9FLAO|nr:hypothetical protein [Mariniflexile gromovii]MBP0903120.1 hypothetical protein [Mariniflexile gromovii]